MTFKFHIDDKFIMPIDCSAVTSGEMKKVFVSL